MIQLYEPQEYKPPAYTVSYLADSEAYSALIVPKGATVTYNGKVYTEGTYLVEKVK